MLNITMYPNDNVLMYDRDTKKLIGIVSCSRILPLGASGAQTDMQFRISDNILVFREALVRKNTDDVSMCPESLVQRFAVHPNRRDSQALAVGG